MKKKRIFGIFINIISIIIAIVYIFPVLVVFINAFKPLGKIIKTPFALPDSLYLDSIKYVFESMNYARALKNTILYSVITVFGSILVSSMAGWMLSRDNSKGSKIFTAILVSSLLVPFHTVMIPLAQIAKNLHIADTRFGYLWIQITLYAPMGVFMYEGFVKNIPVSIEEAARIDGASTFKLFFRIVFPLIKPVTGSIGVLYSLWIWNDYLLAKIILTSEHLKTITIAINSFYGAYLNRWDYAITGVAISIVPVVILYIFLQRYIVEGVAAGAVKA